MGRVPVFVIILLISSLVSFRGLSQGVVQRSPASALTTPEQRLLLQLSFSYFTVVKESQVNLDSSLIYTSRSLGLSRLPVIAEGFDAISRYPNSDWVDRRDPGTALRVLSGLHGDQHLQLLVLLGAYYAFQPKNQSGTRDSALLFLLKAREESTILHEPKWGRQARCLLGKVWIEGNDLKQGAACFNELTDECQAAGDGEIEAKAWTCRGLYTPFNSGATTKDRILYMEKARDLYRRRRNTVGEINALMDMGYLWVSSLQMENGEAAFRQALDLEDSIGFPYTHYTTDAIAMVTLFEGKYGEPLKYALQTVKTAEAVNDSIGWAYFYDRVGVLYSYQENRRMECLQWLERSMDRFIHSGGDPSLYRNLGNITGILAETGRPAEALARAKSIARLYPPAGIVDRLYYNLIFADCYKNLKLYDLAEKNFLEAERLEEEAKSLRGIFSRAEVNARIGMFYFQAGRYPAAKKYCQQFLSDPSRLAVPLKVSMDVEKTLFVLDSASGQKTSAIHHLEQYLRLLDSNFSIAERRQVEELGIQYETEKKEKDIRIRDQHIQALTQADLLRQASLSHAYLVKNITIAGILVMLIIAGLFYRQYRQKQRVNQIVTQTNAVITRKNDLLQRLLTEKDWLLKEVHHRVKNNLHTIYCLLESQASFLENDALKAIENSQNRIYAMSLVHQKLYQSNDIATVDMSLFLPEFLHFLSQSFDLADRIKIVQDVQPVKMRVSSAIPLALILNEGITNAIKYAFPDNARGKIVVSLRAAGQEIQLVIADNGIGMKEDQGTEFNSLGIELMKGLSDEIGAEIYFEIDNGTKITLKAKSELEIESDNIHKAAI